MQLHSARLILGNTSLTHIIDSLFVEPSYGRSMAAFHIVGVNFELRAGENMRGVGKLQVAIVLRRIGSLGIARYINHSGESTGRLVRRNTVDNLAAATIGYQMIDCHVNIGTLRPRSDVKCMQVEFGIPTRQIDRYGELGSSTRRKNERRKIEMCTLGKFDM